MYPGNVNRRHRHHYGRRQNRHHRHRHRSGFPLIPYILFPHRRGFGGLFTGLMVGSIFGATAAVAHNTAEKNKEKQKRQHTEEQKKQQNEQPSSLMTGITEVEPGSAKSVEKQSNIVNISSDEWILLPSIPSAPILAEEEKKEDMNDDQLQFHEEGQISRSSINTANADAKVLFQ